MSASRRTRRAHVSAQTSGLVRTLRTHAMKGRRRAMRTRAALR